LPERRGQRADYIGESAGLGPRRDLGGNDCDSHFFTDVFLHPLHELRGRELGEGSMKKKE
jgi:hypothetical protein